MDLEARVTWASEEVLDVLGYTAAEMVGRTPYEFSTPEESARHRTIFAEISRTAAPFAAVEQTVQHRDGRVVVLESCGMPVFDANGGLRGFRGISRDVTRRKHAENALRESEHLLREAQRIASLGHYTFWASTGLWDSSEELDIIFGIGPDYRRNVEGWLKVLHPDDRAGMQRYLLEHVVRDRNRFDREYRIVRQSDGQVRWVHGMGRLEDDPAGGSLLMIGTIQDITQRKETELALVESENRLRLVTESTKEGVWDWNTLTNRIYFSDTCSTMLGFAVGELAGDFSTWLSLVVEEERAAVLVRVTDCVEGRCEDYVVECRVRTKGGQLRWLRVRGKSVTREPGGRATRVVGTMSDIGERRQLEEQLRQAQKLEAVGQLAGGVAHDFNNILAAMNLQLDLMSDELGPNPQAAEGLEELRKAVTRAAGLTRQLLMFSRRTVPQTQPVSLNIIVVEMLKMLSRLIDENVILHFAAGEDLPPIEADTGMVEQVLMNLVVNARDAMPQGGRLTIRTDKMEVAAVSVSQPPARRPGLYVRLQIEDTGCGMSGEVRKRLFEPFFTTKEVGRGTGLGLATIHGIVAQHQGWIDVESEPGRGSLFIVHWPATTASIGPQRAFSAKNGLPRGRETILLVEDDPLVRRSMAASLLQLGYQVIQAPNGRDALSLCDDKKIDLLLTDMVMPGGVNGMELALTLRKTMPALRVILSSGYSAELIDRKADGCEGFMYLPKPYELAEMAQVVRRCLDA